MSDQSFSIILNATMNVSTYRGLRKQSVAELTIQFCDGGETESKRRNVETNLQYVLENYDDGQLWGTVYEFVKMVKSNLETEDAEFSVFVRFN